MGVRWRRGRTWSRSTADGRRSRRRTPKEWSSRFGRELQARLSRDSVGIQGRAQQGHPMLLEDGRDGLAIGIGTARDRPELLVELVAAAGRVNHNDLAGLICQVQERVRDA